MVGWEIVERNLDRVLSKAVLVARNRNCTQINSNQAVQL